MPGIEQASPVLPRRDPDELLAKLEQLIASQQNKSGAWRWFALLVATVLGIVGVAVWVWIRRRQTKELAKLRHEKNEQEILARKAKADTEVIQLEEQAEAHRKRFEKAAEKLRILEADLRSEEAVYEANRKSIDRIRSWRDISPGGVPGGS